MITELLLKYFFRVQDTYTVFLGTKMQRGCNYAIVHTKELWKKEPIKTKILSILKFKWHPTEASVTSRAKQGFMNNIFGEPQDYAEELYTLIAWHNCRDWDFSLLLELDKKRAESLEVMTLLTRIRLIVDYEFLSLNLANRFPLMCFLTHPMVVKIPIISMQYYLDVHCCFAFNSIRKSKHPHADDIISYLYEIAFIQQKIAISLYEYLNLTRHADNQKKDNLFIAAEINAIMGADAVFSYLKASIEKIIALVGFTHGITNLDSKKTHKAKLDALIKGLPVQVSELYYCKFILDCIKSENLDELNSYRSGLLHKKGIADLQPHNYVGKNAGSIPLKKIFLVLHEQHAENTAILLGALAILTDELVRLDPPNINMEEIPPIKAA
jgi:hypothetical protein